MGLVALLHVESSRIRDQTQVPCIGRKFLTTGPPGKSSPFLNHHHNHHHNLKGCTRAIRVVQGRSPQVTHFHIICLLEFTCVKCAFSLLLWYCIIAPNSELEYRTQSNSLRHKCGAAKRYVSLPNDAVNINMRAGGGGGGLVAKSCLTLATPRTVACQPPLSMGSSSTGVGCHFLLQGIFQTQESNLGFLHCRWVLYWLSYKGSPHMGAWEQCKCREWICLFLASDSAGVMLPQRSWKRKSKEEAWPWEPDTVLLAPSSPGSSVVTDATLPVSGAGVPFQRTLQLR